LSDVAVARCGFRRTGAAQTLYRRSVAVP